MHPVVRLSSGADTQKLRKALWHYRIGHRITDEPDGPLLWVADPRQQEQLKALVLRWERGEPLILDQPAQPPQAGNLTATLRQVPVTASTIVICLVIFALMGLLGNRVLLALNIIPISVASNQLVYGSLSDTLISGQLWRLLSPAFLHFGWMHLLFNLMWLWYFGRQIEALQGSRTMLLLIFVVGISANLAQYFAGMMLFGGMSGVVYGLLGHVWILSKRAPESGFFVSQTLVVFMLGMMVFTMTGLADFLGFGNVANEVHLGGLLVGLATGWLYSRRLKKN